jgi:hypothetical protein
LGGSGLISVKYGMVSGKTYAQGHNEREGFVGGGARGSEPRICSHVNGDSFLRNRGSKMMQTPTNFWGLRDLLV